MQVIHKTVCKPIKGDSQAEGKMYNTRKHKTYHALYNILYLQTLEVQ